MNLFWKDSYRVWLLYVCMDLPSHENRERDVLIVLKDRQKFWKLMSPPWSLLQQPSEAFFFYYEKNWNGKKIPIENVIWIRCLNTLHSKVYFFLLEVQPLTWSPFWPILCRSVLLLAESNIESDNSQNVGLEDYNNISDGIFPHFTTPSIKISLG